MAEAAYVFVYLPRQLRATVAGRFELNSDTSPHVGEFVYGESYLANSSALPLDPIALPLKEQLFRTTLKSSIAMHPCHLRNRKSPSYSVQALPPAVRGLNSRSSKMPPPGSPN